MEELAMCQGTGSKTGTVRLLVNLLAIKLHMTSMLVTTISDVYAISTVREQLTVLKRTVHHHHLRRPRHPLPLLLPLLTIVTTMMMTMTMMLHLRLLHLILGKHGRHSKRSALTLTTTKKIATHERST
jgi:hypothetical protein